jgi:hypothetical protein
VTRIPSNNQSFSNETIFEIGSLGRSFTKGDRSEVNTSIFIDGRKSRAK